MILERITGSRSRLPISLIISIRSHLIHQRTTSALAVLAIASSVGLAVASETSFRSVRAAFQDTAEALVGASDLQVGGGEVGLPEEILERVRLIPGVVSASPMIQQTFVISQGPHAGKGIHVLAVDLLEDRSVRSYSVLSSGLEVRDPLRLMTQPESVIITRVLADRFGLKEGDSLPVRSAHGTLDLTVRGVLADLGVAKAWGGQIAIMDIYGLQTLLGREGWIDRIDIVTDRSVDRAELVTRLRAAVGTRAAVSDASFEDEFVATWLGVLNAGLLAMVVVGILIAALLSYGTISLAADRRMKEFALLASAGLEQPRIRKLILVDSLVLALLGTTLGAALGLPLSRVAMSMFSGVSQSLQHVEIPSLEPGALTVIIAASIGLGVALLGLLEPARRAGIRDPIDVLKAPRVDDGRPAPWAMGIALVLGLGGVAIWVLGILDPVPRAVLALCFGGLGVMGLAVGTAPFLVRMMRPLLSRLVRRVGHLAGAYVEARPLEAGVTLAATVLISAALVMSLVIIQTLVVSVDTMIGGFFEGGFRVKTSAPGQTQRELIPSHIVKRIREVPGVVDIAEFYDTSIVFRGEEVDFGIISTAVLAENANPDAFVDDRGLAGLLRGELVMSRGFSGFFDVSVGDTVELPVRTGSREFRIAGFLHDWGPARGSLHIDVFTFDQIWPREGSNILGIWTERPAEDVLNRVRDVTGDYVPFFTSGEEMSRLAEERFRRFGALLYVVAAVMGALVGAAMVNMLAGAVVARRQELALLQASGATPTNIVSLVLLDGLVVAVVGSAAGFGFGLLGAAIVRDAMTLGLGWKLVFSVDLRQISIALGAVIASSVLVAFYPAWMGSRVRPDVLLGAE